MYCQFLINARRSHKSFNCPNWKQSWIFFLYQPDWERDDHLRVIWLKYYRTLRIPFKKLNMKVFLTKAWVKLYTFKQLFKSKESLKKSQIQKKRKSQKNWILYNLNQYLQLFKQKGSIIKNRASPKVKLFCLRG